MNGNASPAKFAGQTITFEKANLYGIVTPGPARFRFTVKSARTTVLKATDAPPAQKIIFATRNKDQKAKKFVASLSAEQSYTVNLTVTIQRMTGKAGKEGRYWAIVKSVESLPNYRAD